MSIDQRIFTKKEKIQEAFRRTAYVLYSHWRISNKEEKEKLECGGHSRLFEVLIADSYVIKGKSLNGGTYREHIVPCVMIRDRAYLMFNNGYTIEDVADMIEKNLIIILLTKQEREKIDNELKLKTKMPDGWQFGDDPYARLKMANIEVELFSNHI